MKSRVETSIEMLKMSKKSQDKHNKTKKVNQIRYCQNQTILIGT